VLQGFINVSKSFSYKDFLFILARTRKEEFRINSSFKSDFLVYNVHHGDYNPSRKAEPNLQEDLDGPITRERAKQLQRALMSQIGMIEAASELKASNLFRIGSKVLICLQLKLGYGKGP
jgi:hypothetical protein